MILDSKGKEIPDSKKPHDFVLGPLLCSRCGASTPIVLVADKESTGIYRELRKWCTEVLRWMKK